MAARHGTRRCYLGGCRCDDCKGAQRLYQRRYRERSLSGAEIRLHSTSENSDIDTVGNLPTGPGPVELGVHAEISGLDQSRPGLA
jgi:hypothetical protein